MKTFFFYDLETSGLDSRYDRIMQFAGQRTDMNLKKIGEPVNFLIKLSDDTLPSPYALMVTGITPQQTVADGYSEAEAARKMYEEIFTPDTIAVGYNNVRFDDEFLRHLFWRSFFDAYEWSWKDGRSRWDILDLVRMTRALRPDGINWPTDPTTQKPTNRLELLTKENDLKHESAHDALSDVEASIQVANMIKERQPQLFDYLLKMRDKNEVKKLVNLDEKREFVYTSGRYEGEYNKTTVAFPLTAGRNGNVVVYDLRYDPSKYVKMTKDELKSSIFANYEARKKPDFEPIPVKELQYNHVPAIADIRVLEKDDGWSKISLDKDTIKLHKERLLEFPDFAEKIREVYEGRPEFQPAKDVEAKLYDGFLGDQDRVKVELVRNANMNELADLNPDFSDERLPELLLHYKARNYPKALSKEEAKQWEDWRNSRISSKMPSFVKAIEKVSEGDLSTSQQFVLQELQLWLEGIVSYDD